jgi:hypothetical protein
LVDYKKFKASHFTEIVAWKNLYALNYVDVFGGFFKMVAPFIKNKEKKEEGSNKPENENQKLKEGVNPLAQFFTQLHQDYQGRRTNKMKVLRIFVRGAMNLYEWLMHG